MFNHVLLRAETKAGERRTPLIPRHAQDLIEIGIPVWVEASPVRVFPDSDYENAGCSLVPSGTWKHLSPPDRKQTLILGLKELDDENQPLTGHHCYFGHLFKRQKDSRKLLAQFKEGGGTLFDLEYLLDSNGRRLAAFGFWAGYVGAALGLLAWAHRKNRTALGPLRPWSSSADLIQEVKMVLGDRLPQVLITGERGRCGRGAIRLLKDCLPQTALSCWDLAETLTGGPFPEILSHSIWIHAVGNDAILPPFLTEELIQAQINALTLSTVVDVTCDFGNPSHLLPFLDRFTSLEHPVYQKSIGGTELDLIAIDHLPTLLPKESSEDFSTQLYPVLSDFLRSQPNALESWQRSLGFFQHSLNQMPKERAP
jgi:saccharopine dehydrogenase (NAD+, L-lysine-forming)